MVSTTSIPVNAFNANGCGFAKGQSSRVGPNTGAVSAGLRTAPVLARIVELSPRHLPRDPRIA